MATPNAARHRDLEQRFKNLENQVHSLAAVALGRKISPVFATSQYDEDGSAPNFTPAAQTFWAAPAVGTPPAGYSQAHIMLQVSAGATFSGGENNLTVTPVLDYDTASGNTILGPSINSGSNAIAVANSFWSITLAGLDAADFLNLGLMVQLGSGSGTVVSGSCNWHLAASIIYLN